MEKTVSDATRIGPSKMWEKGTGWDYSKPLPPDLSPEFYTSYIINIKGKQYIKVDGLVTLMHAKGFKSIKSELVVVPDPQTNNNTAVFKTTIEGYGWDPIKKEPIDVTVVGYGDANPSNCNSMVAGHFIRIAETRSIGRALRVYTNVNICTLEEIDSVMRVDNITDVQMEVMKQAMTNYGITRDESRSLMIGTYGKQDLKTLTMEEAASLIVLLESLGKTKQMYPGTDAPNMVQEANTPGLDDATL